MIVQDDISTSRLESFYIIELLTRQKSKFQSRILKQKCHVMTSFICIQRDTELLINLRAITIPPFCCHQT